MLDYQELVGRQFVLGEADCFSIIRSFFAKYGINIPNYARPTNFWEVGMDMYMERFHRHGFKVINVHPQEFRPGDVPLMAIQSRVANHAGVLVENGKMLHHLYGRLSTVEPYQGLYRTATLAMLRHPDVVIEQPTIEVNILDLVPEHVRKRIEEAR